MKMVIKQEEDRFLCYREDDPVVRVVFSTMHEAMKYAYNIERLYVDIDELNRTLDREVVVSWKN